jgi:hypothetical protein
MLPLLWWAGVSLVLFPTLGVLIVSFWRAHALEKSGHAIAIARAVDCSDRRSARRRKTLLATSALADFLALSSFAFLKRLPWMRNDGLSLPLEILQVILAYGFGLFSPATYLSDINFAKSVSVVTSLVVFLSLLASVALPTRRWKFASRFRWIVLDVLSVPFVNGALVGMHCTHDQVGRTVWKSDSHVECGSREHLPYFLSSVFTLGALLAAIVTTIPTTRPWDSQVYVRASYSFPMTTIKIILSVLASILQDTDDELRLLSILQVVLLLIATIVVLAAPPYVARGVGRENSLKTAAVVGAFFVGVLSMVANCVLASSPGKLSGGRGVLVSCCMVGCVVLTPALMFTLHSKRRKWNRLLQNKNPLWDLEETGDVLDGILRDDTSAPQVPPRKENGGGFDGLDASTGDPRFGNTAVEKSGVEREQLIHTQLHLRAAARILAIVDPYYTALEISLSGRLLSALSELISLDLCSRLESAFTHVPIISGPHDKGCQKACVVRYGCGPLPAVTVSADIAAVVFPGSSPESCLFPGLCGPWWIPRADPVPPREWIYRNTAAIDGAVDGFDPGGDGQPQPVVGADPSDVNLSEIRSVGHLAIHAAVAACACRPGGFQLSSLPDLLTHTFAAVLLCDNDSTCASSVVLWENAIASQIQGAPVFIRLPTGRYVEDGNISFSQAFVCDAAQSNRNAKLEEYAMARTIFVARVPILGVCDAGGALDRAMFTAVASSLSFRDAHNAFVESSRLFPKGAASDQG